MLADPEELADEAARRISDALARAVERRGRADIALTGGSSAGPLYTRLAAPPLRDRVDWSRVHLWWGDERYVPSDHPDSNARLAYTSLLSMAARAAASGEGSGSSDVLAGDVPGVQVPAHQIHAFPVDQALARGPEGARWAADQYAEELRRELPVGSAGMPTFDVVLLGVGSDGHILSVFPGSPALHEDAPLVLAIPAPTHIEPQLARLTLNPRLLWAAGEVVVMATGSGKADVIARVLAGEYDPRRSPAQLVREGNAVWLLDRAAAAEVPVAAVADTEAGATTG